MVVGYILYESAELKWYLGCITYRGSKSINKWYNAITTPEKRRDLEGCLIWTYGDEQSSTDETVRNINKLKL